ncbi:MULTISPECIES: single-stranded DNA-binding protein [Helicobacter]|uniref:Single-stranded DNA-binding protein n=1 Tax=Helicobacter ganmani TaxID=60246 RepID=A0A3D8IB41_9HELI|nr:MULTISPECIES: single-stranded DNA-binding protein [Helicobacter]RDU62379.1 single-stranded DNA-binding protein [Helicobacter ganmani]
MFNKVILAGNLTRDVELRYLPSGAALAKLGLAVNRRFKKQDGSQGDEVCYIDVNLFGRTAEVANQYLKKGSSVLIEGRLVLESWTDNTGQKRSKHSITAENMQMLGSRNEGGNYGNGGGNGSYGGYQNQNDNYGETTHYNNYGNPQNTQQASAPKPQKAKENEIPVIDIDDEEIPF